ncbi:MAG: PQQ-binding-like beta-propeller repeat protein [Pirellulales bacterium]|nr:PQQ-binding-like beta-propeller repeat protein [Pirellulales bacterium]
MAILGAILFAALARAADTPPPVATPPVATPPAGEAPPFAEVCFDDFDDERGYPGPDELREVFEPASGGQLDPKKSDHGSRPLYQLRGLLRIRPEWQTDSVLRMAVHEAKSLRLHFFSGRQGVTLCYFPDMRRAWAAYGTVRGENRPQPESYALWAVDNGRYYRSRAGTFELRCQDGNLVMTRGDLVLLRAPLGGQPTEVFLECEMLKLRGVAMVRRGPAPRAGKSRPVVFRTDRPTELDWRVVREEEEAADRWQLDKLPDGRVELVVEKNAKWARANAAICSPGLYEYVVEIEDAAPGTGLFLGDAEGKPLHRVAFLRDRRTGRTTFALARPDAGDIEKDYDFKQRLVPYAGHRQWLRLILGAGILTCAVSGDGVHFSDVATEAGHVQGACATLGLDCLPGQQRRTIKLRSIEVRRLAGLDVLATPEIEQIAQHIGPLTVWSVEEWQKRLEELEALRPDGIADDVWQHACDWHAVRYNLTRAVSQPALHRLLRRALAESDDWQGKLRLLDEAGLLILYHDFGDDWNAPKRSDYYHQLGETLLRRGHPTPFTTVNRAVLRMPGWLAPERPFDQELLRCEILLLAQHQRWRELAELCRRMRYWSRISEYRQYWIPWDQDKEATIHLLNWGAAAALRQIGRDRQPQLPAVTPGLRHPLVPSFDKENYNLMTEFRAALEGKAFRAACQVITTAGAPRQCSLLPERDDPSLLVSLPVAVDLAMRRVPGLREAMEEHFGALSRLRVNQAVADGDLAAVEAVARQFRATGAAAEAHGWLGDRMLSAGQWAQACGQYRRALLGAPPESRPSWQARLRLAAAMGGRQTGAPASEPVVIGSMRFSAAEFEQMVDQVRQAADQQGLPKAPDLQPTADPATAGDKVLAAGLRGCPPPGRYELQPWANLGSHQDVRDLPNEDFDWEGRRVSVVFSDGQMLVNNQIQYAAFDVGNGRQLWQQQREPHRQAAWSTEPMWPVVDAERIFVRWPTEHGPVLGCLQRSDGTTLWQANPESPVVCDPMLLEEQLWTLVVRCDMGWELSLELAAFDPETGRRRQLLPLTEFQDHWFEAVSCRAAAIDDRIVVTIGGVALCCDLSGAVHWIRRQIWTPPPSEIRHAAPWLRQVHHQPLCFEDRVYATQPGVWAVECLELETGQLIWRAALPRLLCTVGRIGNRLIVETTDGLTALDTETGKVLWEHATEDRLDTRACGRADALCYVKLGDQDTPQSDQKQPRRPVLVWLDPRTGRTMAETELPIDLASDKTPAIGPLVGGADRHWAFFSLERKPTEREIRELVPVKP